MENYNDFCDLLETLFFFKKKVIFVDLWSLLKLRVVKLCGDLKVTYEVLCDSLGACRVVGHFWKLV